MAAALLPEIRWRAIDADGEVIAGALLYSWAAGTSTPLSTYSDSDLTIANTQPLVADAGGLFGPIYLQPTGYKFGLYPANAAPPVVPISTPYWTQDNVSNPGDIFAATFGTSMTVGAQLNMTNGAVILATTYFATVASSGATVINLPTVATRKMPVLIKNVGAGTVVLTPNGAQTIENSLGTYTIEAALTPLFPSVWLFPDPGSSTWWVFVSHRAA